MKYVLLTMLFTHCVWSQNLEKHQWKERVVLIKADQAHLQLAEQQFDILHKDSNGLIDRKIVVYKCLDEKCTFYNWKDHPQTNDTTQTLKGFKIVLIGLDGGEKYSSTTVVTSDVIFSLIDAMPMRRQELEERKKND
ncbi:MAG: DUF4174 domain-containing protein [Algicola sp.]|nr:DUF4174 domain-containing protein [Algicola sp.]